MGERNPDDDDEGVRGLLGTSFEPPIPSGRVVAQLPDERKVDLTSGAPTSVLFEALRWSIAGKSDEDFAATLDAATRFEYFAHSRAKALRPEFHSQPPEAIFKNVRVMFEGLLNDRISQLDECGLFEVYATAAQRVMSQTMSIICDYIDQLVALQKATEEDDADRGVKSLKQLKKSHEMVGLLKAALAKGNPETKARHDLLVCLARYAAGGGTKAMRAYGAQHPLQEYKILPEEFREAARVLAEKNPGPGQMSKWDRLARLFVRFGDLGSIKGKSLKTEFIRLKEQAVRAGQKLPEPLEPFPELDKEELWMSNRRRDEAI